MAEFPQGNLWFEHKSDCSLSLKHAIPSLLSSPPFPNCYPGGLDHSYHLSGFWGVWICHTWHKPNQCFLNLPHVKNNQGCFLGIPLTSHNCHSFWFSSVHEAGYLPFLTRCMCAFVLNRFGGVWLFADPMDCSPSGSSVHGIPQARILEWVAMLSSKGSSRPRDQTQVFFVFCIGRWLLYH